jgi:hypothetical protein
LLLADLSRVAGCDGRLFDLLARTHHMLDGRGGWLRLVGLGPSVLAALDQAALPEVLLVYPARRGRFMRSTDHARTAALVRRHAGELAATAAWAAALPGCGGIGPRQPAIRGGPRAAAPARARPTGRGCGR